MKRILDDKYKESNLKTITESSTYLVKKYESLFGINLVTWHDNPYDTKVKPDAEPYHGKHFPVPRMHELTFKQ